MGGSGRSLPYKRFLKYTFLNGQKHCRSFCFLTAVPMNNRNSNSVTVKDCLQNVLLVKQLVRDLTEQWINFQTVRLMCFAETIKGQHLLHFKKR